MSYQSFREWMNNADMPEKDEKGVWVDLETGRPWVHPTNWLPTKTVQQPKTEAELIYGKLKLAELTANVQRYIRDLRMTLDRTHDDDMKDLVSAVIAEGETLMSNKPKKAELFAFIDVFKAACAAVTKRRVEAERNARC